MIRLHPIDNNLDSDGKLSDHHNAGIGVSLSEPKEATQVLNVATKWSFLMIRPCQRLIAWSDNLWGANRNFKSTPLELKLCNGPFIDAHWCILKRLGVSHSGSCFFGGAVTQDILRYYNDQAVALQFEFFYRSRISLGPVVVIGIIMDLTKEFGLIQISFIFQPPIWKPSRTVFAVPNKPLPLVCWSPQTSYRISCFSEMVY